MPRASLARSNLVGAYTGRSPPLPVKIIQLETAFTRAQARTQTLAHVLLSVKESPNDGYYASEQHACSM